MRRAKLAAAAAAAAAAAGVAYFRRTPVSEVIVPKAIVSNDPVYVAPNYDATVTNPSPSPQFLQESTLSPISHSRSHTRLSPPRSPPPSLFYPPSPSVIIQPNIALLYTSPLKYSSLLKPAQINKDGKVTDIIATGYSQKKSIYLLDEPPILVVKKAKENLAPDRSEKLIIFTEILPSIDGVNWTTIMPKIYNFYEYLGQTFGKYEVHLMITATTDQQESDKIRNKVIAQIAQDINLEVDGQGVPAVENLKKDCGTAVCHKYEAKNGKIRYLVNIDIGSFYNGIVNNTHFNKMSNEDKEQFILSSLCYFMAHEYYHVFQGHLISPFIDPNGFGAEDTWAKWDDNKEMTSGEKQPHAISRWWTESFATIMPYFLGTSEPSDKGMLERVKNAITNITSDKTLTKEEFSDRMMYRFTDYGYLMSYYDRQDWAFLAAACMAQRKSWNYLLAGHFYKDFQRIKSDTPIKKDGETIYVPDADNIWLHNFGKTQKEFLHSIFDLVKSGEITVNSLRDFLPGGESWYI